MFLKILFKVIFYIFFSIYIMNKFCAFKSCLSCFFVISHVFNLLSVFRFVQSGQLAIFEAVQKLSKIGCVAMVVWLTEDWTALAKKNAVYIYTCVCVCVCMCVYIIL